MRTTTIILVALLVLSVIANAVLGYTSFSLFVKNNQQQLTMTKQAQTITDTQTRLATTITQYNDVVVSLNSATAANDELTVRVDQLEDEATRNAKTMNDYRTRMNAAESFVSRAMCSVTANESEVMAAKSNEDVRAELIRVFDEMYYTSNYAYSQWITMWNNRRDAVLQIFNTENASARFIVSWNSQGTAIQSIYSINSGCVMYAGGDSW
ncbi:MAG: hypothetical protein ACK5GU_06860 [Chloroflexota bacterium]|jgi:hypothetical protein